MTMMREWGWKNTRNASYFIKKKNGTESCSEKKITKEEADSCGRTVHVCVACRKERGRGALWPTRSMLWPALCLR